MAEIIRLDLSETEKQSRIQREALEIDGNLEKFSWQMGELVKMLPQFNNPGVRRGVGGLVKGYLFDYKAAGSKKYEKEINVELPVDSKIPFEPKAVSTYVSHIGLLMSEVNYLHKEFGKEAAADIGNFTAGIAGLYPDAGEIFRNAQTSFRRTGEGGLATKVLRLVDSEKNASPSLHVEMVGFGWSRFSGIIDSRAKDPKVYEPMKKMIFEKTVKILEAILLVKQHVVMDVGVGLAVLSGRKSGFARQQAESLVNAMFTKDSHGMSAETIEEVHSAIMSIYDDVMARVEAQKGVPLPQVIVGYLKDFEVKAKSFSAEAGK